MSASYNFYKKIDLVILSGGKGTRIKKFLGPLPKPMIKFNNKNFTQYVLNAFSKFNFKRIFILCGYRSNIFFKKFHNKKINLTKITCIKEKHLLGTGGALFNLKKFNVKDFILMNGDTIFNINLNTLVDNFSEKKNRIGIIALTQNKNQQSKKLNLLKLNKNLVCFTEKSSVMNGGIYFFKSKIFKYVLKKKMSLERDILPKLIKRKKIEGKFFHDFFLDIGSKLFLSKAPTLLKNEFTKKAIFLDRDGVINYDYGHVHKLNSFRFREGVIDGLKYLTKKKFYIFIVTNQAGIGKKIYSENNFINLHKEINKRFVKHGIYIDEVQFSPYHPKALDPKYKKNSRMRKPGNKMIENIKANWDINLKKSFMIGDKPNDMKASKKSKLKFFYAEKNFNKQVRKIINNY